MKEGDSFSEGNNQKPEEWQRGHDAYKKGSVGKGEAEDERPVSTWDAASRSRVVLK